MSSMESLELDNCLELLARYYSVQRPSANALPLLLERLRREGSRVLPDDELEWLAAAGPLFRPPEDGKP